MGASHHLQKGLRVCNTILLVALHPISGRVLGRPEPNGQTFLPIGYSWVGSDGSAYSVLLEMLVLVGGGWVSGSSALQNKIPPGRHSMFLPISKFRVTGQKGGEGCPWGENHDGTIPRADPFRRMSSAMTVSVVVAPASLDGALLVPCRCNRMGRGGGGSAMRNRCVFCPSLSGPHLALAAHLYRRCCICCTCCCVPVRGTGLVVGVVVGWKCSATVRNLSATIVPTHGRGGNRHFTGSHRHWTWRRSREDPGHYMLARSNRCLLLSSDLYLPL